LVTQVVSGRLFPDEVDGIEPSGRVHPYEGMDQAARQEHPIGPETIWDGVEDEREA